MSRTVDRSDRLDPDQSKALKGIESELSATKPNLFLIEDAIRKHDLTEEDIGPLVETCIAEELYDRNGRTGILEKVFTLQAKFQVPITSKLRKQALKAIMYLSKQNRFQEAERVKNIFKVEITRDDQTILDHDTISRLAELLSDMQLECAGEYIRCLGMQTELVKEAGERTICDIVTSKECDRNSSEDVQNIARFCLLTGEEEHRAVLKGFKNLVHIGQIKEAKKWKKRYRISDNDLQETAVKGIDEGLDNCEWTSVGDIGSSAYYACEIAKGVKTAVMPRMRAKAERALMRELLGSYGIGLTVAIELVRLFEIPVSKPIQKIAALRIDSVLATVEREPYRQQITETIKNLAKVAKALRLDTGTTKKKVTAAAKRWLQNDHTPTELTQTLLREFGLAKEAKELAIEACLAGKPRRLLEIIDTFGIAEDNRAQALIMEELEESFERNDVEQIVILFKKFSLVADEDYKAKGQKAVLKYLEHGYINQASLRKALELFDINLDSPEMVEASTKGVISMLRHRNHAKAMELLETVGVDIASDEVRSAALRAISQLRQDQEFATARKVAREFGIKRGNGVREGH